MMSKPMGFQAARPVVRRSFRKHCDRGAVQVQLMLASHTPDTNKMISTTRTLNAQLHHVLLKVDSSNIFHPPDKHSCQLSRMEKTKLCQSTSHPPSHRLQGAHCQMLPTSVSPGERPKVPGHKCGCLSNPASAAASCGWVKDDLQKGNPNKNCQAAQPQLLVTL